MFEEQRREPLRVRIFQALVYLSMIGAGIVGLFNLPSTFLQLVGQPLAEITGLFSMLGSVIGTISALVGAHWLERVAILFAITGLGMFTVGLAYTAIPSLGLWFALAFAIALVNRLVDITWVSKVPIDERK